MQSNFGIVTKMGYWLMPEPESTCRSGCASGTTTTSGRVVDTLRELMLDDTIRMVPQICNTLLHRLGVRRRAPSGTTATGPIPDDVHRPDGP